MDDTLILVFDEALLDSMREIVEKRRKMTNMLEKAEQHKHDVNDRVYQNVVTDYRQRLSHIDTEYQPLQQQMNAELQRIRSEQQKVESDLEAHRQHLEEARFRFQVGEYCEEELQLKEQKIDAELQRLEGFVATANLTQGTAKELLGDDIEAQQPVPGDLPQAPPINAADSREAQDAGQIDHLLDEMLCDMPEPSDLDEPAHEPAGPSSASSAIGDTNEIPCAKVPGQEEHKPKERDLDDLFGLSEDSSSNLADAFATPADGSHAPASNHTETQPEIATAEPDDDATELMTVDLNADPDRTQLAPLNDQLHQALLRGFLRQMQPHDGGHWEITAEGLVLGRSPRCDVVIHDPNVSRRHAVIAMEAHVYYIEDMSSGGGVRINGEAVSKQQLSSGDEIAVGEQLFIFHTEHH